MNKTNKTLTKLTVAKTDLSEVQLLKILQRTPADHIYTRPAKGGGTWDYVTGVYVEKVLNYVFGWNWDFIIVNHGVAQKSIWVQGRLIVRTGNTTITKEQFGRADIKFRTKIENGARVPTDEYLDYGNDLKAAATDALKKCASKLGIASDVYGKNEFKEIKKEELKEEMAELIAPEKPANKILPIKEVPSIDIAGIRKGLNGN